MAQELVTLQINGRSVSVPRGTTVWEAARRIGIEIPYFCHHPKLEPVGACRQCVVEIEKMPKLQTSCTTVVAEGMVVNSRSAVAREAQEAVLEFLLVNHPLDCPICDKGGECPLQDFTFRYGPEASRTEEPRIKFDKARPLSEDIVIDQERCILCYRCTRFYSEVVGDEELVATERGAHSSITTAPGRQLESMFSGNIIELCPVGALTSRHFRFRARPWDMKVTASTCSHCAVGCNVTLWGRRGQLERITSRENPAVDDGWLCDRGRFRYEYVNDEEKIAAPTLVERTGNRPVTWEEALGAVAADLGRRADSGQASGEGELKVLLGSAVSNEEAHLATRLAAHLGAGVAQAGRSTLPAATPSLGIAEIATSATILVVGTDPEREAPILDLWIRRAVTRHRARLAVATPEPIRLSTLAAHDQRAAGAEALAEMSRHLQNNGAAPAANDTVAILYGDWNGTEDGSATQAAVQELVENLRAAGRTVKLLPVLRAANEFGANVLGVSSRLAPGAMAGRTVLAIGLAPEEGALLQGAVRVTWLAARPPLGVTADILLPGTTYPEKNGTITNLEGRVQPLRMGLVPTNPRREEWSVLLELGRLLGGHFPEVDLLEVQASMVAAAPALAQVAVGRRPTAPTAGANPSPSLEPAGGVHP